MRIKASHIIIVLIILVAIGLRIFVLLNTDHLDNLSSWETNNCYVLSPHPFNFMQYWSIANGTTSQAGYYFFNALLMHLLGKPILVSRMISFVFGVLTIVPYYLLVRSIFSREVAFASIFALAFYPIHVQISTASYAHAAALFFVILSLYYLKQYLYGGNLKKNNFYFACSIASCILATAFRLDSWFVPVIIFLLLLLEKRFKAALLFFASSTVYITTAIFMFYNIHKAPLPFLGALAEDPSCRGFVNLLSKSGGISSFDRYQFLAWVKTFLNRLSEPSFYHKAFTVVTSSIDNAWYGKFRALIWFNALFRTISLHLSVLGFFGMLAALRQKKQHIFLVSFWTFFIVLAARQFMSNQIPNLRYSHLFAIFFIPFIFLGISKIAGFVSKVLGLSGIYKSTLIFALIFTGNIYFIFFSADFIIKNIPCMKFLPLDSDLSVWVKKNVRYQDLMFFSLGSSRLCYLTTSNELMEIPFGESELSNALFGKGFSADGKMFDEIIDFTKTFDRAACKPEGEGSPLFIALLSKNKQSQEIRRIVFILDECAQSYLKDKYPYLSEKIKIRLDKSFYSGILNL